MLDGELAEALSNLFAADDLYGLELKLEAAEALAACLSNLSNKPQK